VLRVMDCNAPLLFRTNEEPVSALVWLCVCVCGVCVCVCLIQFNCHINASQFNSIQGLRMINSERLMTVMLTTNSQRILRFNHKF
jgi:hypothetical protein